MKKTIQFMLKKNVLPVVVVVLLSGIFWAYQSQGGNGRTLTKQEKILTTLGAIIEQNHYSPKPIDDKFSKDVFKKFIESVDPEKNIFLDQDIKGLKKYETQIDDEVHGAPMQLVPAVNELYAKRIVEVNNLYKDILAKPFDFLINEIISTDNDKIKFAANEAGRKDMWRKKLKFMALDRFVAMQEEREKNKDSAGYVVKNDVELEKEARSKVEKIMDKNFNRLKIKFNDDERFNLFINTITAYMDPHSDYQPPVEKRSFEEQMSGTFFGIGASLREEDGNIKIATLLSGSPAWKSGQINVGDIIVKVAQGREEPVETAGFAVEDAVKIIRGNKGTEVRLTLKKADGAYKVVSIIRDKIVQDEVYVRSAIVKGEKKIGYIYLPDFYADYENPKGNRCARDVANEVEKLKAEKVDGIVIDLRNNGGGYLSEVVTMVGLFIPEGPIVQVRDKQGKPTILSDNDKSVIYTGPLVVMINEFSASASEIFAAAIQDYGRGLVVGSTSSFGKGTVQRSIPFGRPVDFFSGQTEYGAIKLTLQKFYRIDGRSTQLKGVSPDIIFPDEYEKLKFREKDSEYPLPWDEIEQTNYTKWTPAYDRNAVIAAGEKRIAANENFKLLKEKADWLFAQSNKSYSLQINKYKEEQQVLKAYIKKNENLAKLTLEMPVEGLKADDYKYNNVDKEKGERYKNWIKNLKKDLYLYETTKVVEDMLDSKKGFTKN